MHEDIRNWSTGYWVHVDSLYHLEAGDWLMAIDDVIAATECETPVPRGSRCKLLGWDKDGDAIVSFRLASGACKRIVIFAQDLDKLSLE